MNHSRYIELAKTISRIKEDDRTYFHGCVGIRNDGVIVCASNGNPKFPEPEHHAEARVLRKLGKYGILFVVRTLANGDLAESNPCPKCWARIHSKKVRKVFWSTGDCMVPIEGEIFYRS